MNQVNAGILIWSLIGLWSYIVMATARLGYFRGIVKRNGSSWYWRWQTFKSLAYGFGITMLLWPVVPFLMVGLDKTELAQKAMKRRGQRYRQNFKEQKKKLKVSSKKADKGL